MSVAITKIELVPQSVDCGSAFTISVCAYEISNGAGDRRLPFRLKDDPHVAEQTIG